MLTRKHFVLIAKSISAIADPVARKVAAEQAADESAKTNPRFKRDVFLKACGV